LQRLGCEVVDAGILADDLERTRQCLAGLGDVDLILSTGGVSVGEADYLGLALREAGELALWKLAIKPGKPLTFGHYQGVPVIGLPGNPASTLVTFGLLARPTCCVVRAWPMSRRCASRAGGFRLAQAGQSSGIPAGAHRRRPGTHLQEPELRGAAQRWPGPRVVEVREGSMPRQGELVPFIPFSELLG
jgi:molybdopterin molybdotransferase